MMSTDESFAVELVCKRIRLGKFAANVQDIFRARSRKSIAEFNLGVADRFFDSMSMAETLLASGYFMDEIREIDALTKRKMIEHGYRAIYDAMHARREARMQAIMASLPARAPSAVGHALAAVAS